MKVARGGVLTGVGLCIAVGCGSSDSSSPNDGVIVSGPEGGVIGAPPPPPPAVGGEAPEGVFVSASKGIPDADGSRLRPVTTIAQAITLAQAKHLPVIVCAEAYAEAVTLAEGITMFGYFDCSNLEKWVRVDRNASITAPTSPAVLAKDLVGPLRFEGFDVDGPSIAGTAAPGSPAASSIAMMVRNCKNLTLASLNLHGGKGQDGRDGVEPAEPNAELSGQARGEDAPYQHECVPNRFDLCDEDYIGGGAPGSSSCRFGPSGGVGGSGGMGVVVANTVTRQPAFVTFQAAGSPLAASPATNVGGTVAKVGLNAGNGGNDGANGPTGSNGAWSFTKDGFVPGDGTAGQNGLPGQGGGGGAGTTGVWLDREGMGNPKPSATWYGAAGGGGGAGGCPGIAGTAGTGGGAGIGLFVAESSVVIEKAIIGGGTGGNAGKGTLGTAGLLGGAGGRGIWTPGDLRTERLYGGAGGKGGTGGAAGLSGNGASGPAIAFVHDASTLVVKEVLLGVGAGGEGAPALTRGGQSLAATPSFSRTEHTF